MAYKNDGASDVSKPTFASEQCCIAVVYVIRRVCNSLRLLSSTWPLSTSAWRLAGRSVTGIRITMAQTQSRHEDIIDRILAPHLFNIRDPGCLHDGQRVGSGQRDNSSRGRPIPR